MKNRIITLLAIIIAVGIMTLAVNCKKEPPMPPVPPKAVEPAPVVAPQVQPAEPQFPIPPFSEQTYIDIAAKIDFLRSKYPGDEPKVAEELIKYVNTFGYNVKSEQELESSMISLSKQLEDASKTKGPNYQKELDAKVQDRVSQFLIEDANAPAPEEKKPETPLPSETPPAEQPK